jgi:hypothetical protein
MARTGCGTTEVAVGWNWLPLLDAGWCQDLRQQGRLERTVSWRPKEGGRRPSLGMSCVEANQKPFFLLKKKKKKRER